MRVDAHHHLWRYSAQEFGWISDEMDVLRRDFLPRELQEEMNIAQVDATVVVQARQTEEETRWLLSLTSVPGSPIAGVVGWLPIADQHFGAALDRYAGDPQLRGLRHIVQAEPDGFLDGADFNRGISLLRNTPLVYDILIYSRQLPETIRFVDRHPQQVFVLDHIGKPNIRGGEFADWERELRDLARRPNVFCKISGMVTEADISCWTADALRPYFDVVVEAFTPARLMIGTDWPVLTAGCSYAQWWAVVTRWTSAFSHREQADILGDTAASVYKLSV